MIRAESLKLLTLPSLRWTLLLTWPCAALLRHAPADPVFYLRAGFLVFGVLATASEHQAGGQIRTTLLAMPRRWLLQGAKLVALTAVAAPAALIAALLAGHPAATADLTLTTLLAAAVATIVRHAVTAVVLVLGVCFIAEPLLHTADHYLPATGRPATTAAWTTLTTAAAAALFHRRDP